MPHPNFIFNLKNNNVNLIIMHEEIHVVFQLIEHMMRFRLDNCNQYDFLIGLIKSVNFVNIELIPQNLRNNNIIIPNAYFFFLYH